MSNLECFFKSEWKDLIRQVCSVKIQVKIIMSNLSRVVVARVSRLYTALSLSAGSRGMLSP